jgi:HAD superfamily phosphoserine phosphatase-like hydrolase
MTCSVCLLDWDGTLREGYVILQWTQYLARKGEIPKRFVEAMEKCFEYEDYEQMAECVVETYASSQKGLRVADVDRLAIAFAESNPGTFAFAAPLIKYLRRKKIEPIVITGSPNTVVKHLAKKIGVHRCYGLELKIDRSGAFVGTYEFNMAIEKNKRMLVKRLETEFRDVRLALGNSGSDGPLLEVARCGYFITGDPDAAIKVPRLRALIREGRLREVSPEQLLGLVESEQVFWR